MVVRNGLRILGEYLLLGALCLVLLTVLLDLPHRDLAVPFDYHGDSLGSQLWLKAIADHGWYLHAPNAGAPHGLDMQDFPMSDNVHFLLAKMVSLLSHEASVIFNVQFLSTFVLIAWTSLFVFRHFGIHYLPALTGSLVFAFMPFHFQYIQGNLAGYFHIPLLVMVVLWVLQGGSWTKRRWLGGLLIAALVSAGGVYFAFFSCFFLALAGLSAWLNQRRWTDVARAWTLIGVIALGSIINVLPTLIYAARNGQNLESANRMMGEAEHFSLRIAQLLMPVSGHRVPFLAWVKTKFNSKLMLVTENDKVALGLFASLGFLLLMFGLLRRRRDTDPGPGRLLDSLSMLNVFAVLLGTIGGLGLLCAAALPQIRAYARICVFIGFFAVFAMTLCLDALYHRRNRTRQSSLGWTAGLGVLTVLAVLDQTPASWGQADPPHAEEYRRDVRFVRQMEEALPAGAMVYEMPYRIFPEGGRLDQLRWCALSSKLHWSYPAMRGRLPDLWQRHLATQPIDQILPTLAYVGFQGILIDRIDFQDQARSLEKSIALLTAASPMEHPDGRWVFYPLTAYVARLRLQNTEERWAGLKQQALEPVLVQWKRGFSQFEEKLGEGGRWCGAGGEMVLHNLSVSPQTVVFSASFASGSAEPAHLQIASPVLDKRLLLGDSPGQLQERLTLPPGPHVVRFSCDSRPFQGSQRKVFKVLHYAVEKATDNAMDREP